MQAATRSVLGQDERHLLSDGELPLPRPGGGDNQLFRLALQPRLTPVFSQVTIAILSCHAGLPMPVMLFGTGKSITTFSVAGVE